VTAKRRSDRRQVNSFGEEEAGELYLCDHAGGAVLRIAPAARE